MRLVTFQHSADGESVPRIGALDLEAGRIVDFSAADPEMPRGMNGLIALGEKGLDMARAAFDGAGDDVQVDRLAVRILAPIPQPRRNLLAVGRNYHEHAKEFHDSGFDATAGAEAVPEFPIIFSKATTSVVGPSAPILSSLDPTGSVDYEGELGVIIGPGGRAISEENALDHVYGYTVINDVTARDLQAAHTQWLLGKSIDTFCPIGPWIVSADELIPDDLDLKCWVNGELRQHANTRDLVFDVPAIIEAISASMTLSPGDIIATGTPAGVGIGFDPPKFLRPGDRVRVAIEGIGEIENKIL